MRKPKVVNATDKYFDIIACCVSIIEGFATLMPYLMFVPYFSVHAA